MARESFSDLPIIVGGCFRSGTSLVRRLLNAHSRIFCGPEVKFLRDFHGDYIEDELAHIRFLRSARAWVSDDELLEVAGRAFVELHERAARQAGKARWADKNPENVLYLDAWERLLGERFLFVHVVRSPLANLASIAEANFRLTIPGDLDGRIDLYRRYNEAGLAIGERLASRYRRVRYEDLVTRPADELAELMTWLGEEAEPMQLRFNELPQGSGLEDPKIADTAGVHARSVDRSELFDAATRTRIERETGALWRRLSSRDAA